MATKTFQSVRDYISVHITQNLNYMHFREVLNDMLDLIAVATNTYSGGENIEITSDGTINLVADENTEERLNKGYTDGYNEAIVNKK